MHVDTLIKDVLIVTMDTERRVITHGAVAIKGDRIAAIGKAVDIVPGIEAAETIDGRRFLMTPGLINFHVHTTETLIKSFMPEALDFDEAVWRWAVPLYQGQTPAEQCLGAQLSALAMLRSGTTCFVEAGTVLAMDEVFATLDATGIRGRIGEWVLDRAFSPDQDQTALTDAAFRQLERELVRYPCRAGQRLAAWPLLIGHNTATDALWRGAKQLADEHGAGITAHMSPAVGDPDWYLANTGARPVTHLAALGALGPNVSLTHMVHVDAAEVAALAATGTNVIHCPAAALKGAYGTTQLGLFPEMAAAGVTLMLGTDGADTADLMRPMALMAGLYKDARRDQSVFPADRILEMATVNAAKALGLSHDIGSLEVGKKADLVLHDLDRPEWRPMLNPINHLVWSADGRSVHSVWIDGRRVVDNYRCATIDEERLYAEAQPGGRGLCRAARDCPRCRHGRLCDKMRSAPGQDSIGVVATQAYAARHFGGCSMTYRSIDVTRLTPVLGAEISGVDLTQPLPPEQVADLHQALADHLVIFFRDQKIDHEQHKTLARHFGGIHIAPSTAPWRVPGHPEVTIIHADADSKYVAGEDWHSDMTCDAEPPLGSILYLHTVPETGGDTVFSSMYAAYDRLSDRMKAYLEGLTAVHDAVVGFGGITPPGMTLPKSSHPVIRTHPVTGKKALFVNHGFTTRIEGVPEKESAALLAFLFQHVQRPEFQCRFRWRPHSIAFWDNRSLQHSAIWDYFPQTRSGFRIQIAGDRPV